ncbi:MAG: Imm50 family immunity protein [Endozoicomonas sp.]
MWNQLLQNPEFIDSIYEIIPKLNKVRVHSIELSQDGPVMKIRFDIDILPSNPPKKWGREYNRIQLALVLIEISNLSLLEWKRDNILTLSFHKKNNGRIAFSAIGDSCSVSCVCSFLRLDYISPYLN